MTNTMNWSLTPYLVVSDAARAIAFYHDALGARELMRLPSADGTKVLHATLDLHGATVHLSDDFDATGQAGRGAKVKLHLQVPDVDSVFNRAIQAGATSTMPPADMFWGDRFGTFTDPFGHEWSVGTPKRKPTQEDLRRGAEEFDRMMRAREQNRPPSQAV